MARGPVATGERAGPVSLGQRLLGIRWHAQAQGWADAIRQCFEVYRHIADADTRAAFTCGLSRTLDLPPDELAVYIDVVLTTRAATFRA